MSKTQQQIVEFATHCAAWHTNERIPTAETVVIAEVRPLQKFYESVFGESLSNRGIVAIVLRGMVEAHPRLPDTFFHKTLELPDFAAATLKHLGVETFSEVVECNSGTVTVTCWKA
jgi:hypothetical protein